MASVSFDQVSKTFPDGTRAIEGFDLEVADGELLVLLGPSGCGKSTLLRLLAGLEAPSSGSIRLDGKRIDALSPRARNVAMVFQDYALYPHMRVRENLEFPLRMARLARAERNRRVEEIAVLLELQSLLERRPAELSGGQRQRVAMGRALVRDPAVFLLDEPLSNLDARLRAQLRSEIRDLQARIGTTTLYVTHDQTEAMTLGDRIAVLRAGRMEQVGTPTELYDRPATPFVAAFLGNPGANLFESELRATEAGYRLDAGAVSIELPAALGESGQAQGLIVGLRPEDLRVRTRDDSGSTIAARVRAVENLGHEALLYCDSDLRIVRVESASPAGADALIARMPSTGAPSAGAQIRLGFEPARMHLFDRRTGQRLVGLR
jgi:multiple sugar transport system ATP-binding protein